MKKDTRWLLDAIEEAGKTAMKNGEYWRATYTPEDELVVKLLIDYMKSEGMITYFDGVGNLYGRIEGKTEDVILIGSHRDTVRHGGKYDGILGVLAGIRAAGSLFDTCGQPKKTVEIVAICEEESSRFTTSDYIGSNYICGTMPISALKLTDSDNITLGDAIKSFGFKCGELKQESRPEIKHFVEMHVEQGGLLEHEGKQIGIVKSIVGQWGGRIEFTGQQNHAGTTPMALRSDPVPVMAEFITKMFSWVEQYKEDTVLTVGKIQLEPGSSNVIPCKSIINFDIRSSIAERGSEALKMIMDFKEKMEGRIDIDVFVAWEDNPVELNQEGINVLENILCNLDYPYMFINSGAGHDSQNMARVYPTNMIFVPSMSGISHSEKEFTRSEDLDAGLDVLSAYIKRLAW
ncbi:MAG: M20 family metallo-hydrolase [Eubacteriales bacterium]|nr:M20 family metallo-hydrolase [Eubacteriales bacterium]